MKETSIIIPFKNESKYIKDCIQSVLSQTEQNWELILVDDHSTDNSAGIIKAFSDERILYIVNQGEGVIAALNTAYDVSSGNYITRMDADDLMSRDRIELMTKALKNDGLGNVAVGLVEYFGESLKDGYKKYARWLNGLTMQASNFSEIYKECVIPSPNWMMHRSDFEQLGGFNNLIYPEDYDLAFRMYAAKLTITPIKDCTLYWRDHPMRSSRTVNHYADNNFLFLKIKRFLQIDKKVEYPLYLWGAGKKGKEIAKLLIDSDISFYWLTDNAKKVGKDIYGLTLLSSEVLNKCNESQVIIAIANEKEQQEIRKRLASSSHASFWFC